MSSSLVLAGTVAGLVQVFDVESHQLLRSITTYKGKDLRITTVATMLKPLDLIGHVNLNVGVSDGFAVYVKSVAPFMKVKDAKAMEKKEVWISGGDGHGDERDDSASLSRSILLDQAFFLDPSASKTSPINATTSASDSLQSQVLLLREQLGKAKTINDTMWERIVQKLFLGETQSGNSEEIEGAGNERRESNKRTRV
jgi:pre-rRNA-processing protein IPI3